MNKISVLTITLLLVLGAALPVYAMSMSGSDHQNSSAGHDKLAALGEQTVDGVKATAHLGDVRAAMANAGQPMTHHLQIVFTDLGAMKPIYTGTVAVKVTLPSGEELPAQVLMGMDGHFGVDLTLTSVGTYKFALGTMLADGKKRQFEFLAPVN